MFLRGVAEDEHNERKKKGVLRMKRIFLVLAVAAIMTALMAAPALADKGGEKPTNYGDCVSAIATGNLGDGSTTPSEFNELSDPPKAKGGDDTNIGCLNFPPG